MCFSLGLPLRESNRLLQAGGERRFQSPNRGKAGGGIESAGSLEHRSQHRRHMQFGYGQTDVRSDVYAPGHVAVLPGDRARSRCIPMAHGVDSLNVAAASAVAFWETRWES